MSEPVCKVKHTVRNGGPCGAVTDGFMCRVCSAELEDAVAQIPALMRELTIAATRQARVFRGGPARRTIDPATADPEADITARLRSRDGRITLPSTASPVDFDAADLMRLAAGALTEWVTHFGGTGRTTTERVHWLVRESDTIRHDNKAPQAHRRLTRLQQQMERAIDMRLPGEFVGHCDAPDVRIIQAVPTGPVCSAFTCTHVSCEEARTGEAVLTPVPGVCGAELYAAEGARTITCDVCGAEHNATERRRTMATTVDDEWARPATIAKALSKLDHTIKPATLRKWIERDRLAAALPPHRQPAYPLILQRGIDDDGNAVYRVGDVRARVQSMHEKTDQQQSA